MWRKPIEAVASRASQREPDIHVRCAYLELMEPGLAACAAELAALGVLSITVVPLFLGVGKHAREDLPVLIDNLIATFPLIQFTLLPAVGEDERLIELMATIALST